MSLKLLRSPLDWTKYQQAFCDANNLGGMQMNWGKGPQEYPCLAASLLATSNRIVTCFVYKENAKELMIAAAESHPAMKAMQQAESPPGHSQADFNRDVSASLLTIAYFLTETAICKPEAYEQKKIEMLAKVDQFQAEEVDRLRAERAESQK